MGRQEVLDLKEMLGERSGIKTGIKDLEEFVAGLEQNLKEQERMLTDTQGEKHILKNANLVCKCVGECQCGTEKFTTTKRLEHTAKRLEALEKRTAGDHKEVQITLKEHNCLIDACRSDLGGGIEATKTSLRLRANELRDSISRVEGKFEEELKSICTVNDAQNRQVQADIKLLFKELGHIDVSAVQQESKVLKALV